MRGLPFLAGTAAVVLALTVTSPVRAACERFPTAQEEFSEADFVFIARVIAARIDWSRAEPGEFNGVEYTVQPLKSFKGDPPPELLLYSENSSGRFPMMVAGWYMLFVGPPYQLGFGDEARRERAINYCGQSFEIRAVPLALEPHPTSLSFEQVMALKPDDG